MLVSMCFLRAISLYTLARLGIVTLPSVYSTAAVTIVSPIRTPKPQEYRVDQTKQLTHTTSVNRGTLLKQKLAQHLMFTFDMLPGAGGGEEVFKQLDG